MLSGSHQQHAQGRHTCTRMRTHTHHAHAGSAVYTHRCTKAQSETHREMPYTPWTPQGQTHADTNLSRCRVIDGWALSFVTAEEWVQSYRTVLDCFFLTIYLILKKCEESRKLS